MMPVSLEEVLRRDRLVVAASLAALAVLAWVYTARLSGAMGMGGMTMAGMRMDANPFGAAMIGSLTPWSAAEFVFALLMWAVMMVGMMTPSAAPMILIYARVGRQAEREGKPLAAVGYFGGGYLLAWTAFSLLATAGQWALDRAMVLNSAMQVASPVLGGALLVAAGLYQWTPAKAACLRHCQGPLRFIQRHGGFRRSPWGSLKLGFLQGLYCLGCCWALMALLFAGGVMNVLWIAGIALLVLAEKVSAAGYVIARVVGAALIGAGAWVAASALL